MQTIKLLNDQEIWLGKLNLLSRLHENIFFWSTDWNIARIKERNSLTAYGIVNKLKGKKLVGRRGKIIA